MRRKYPAVNIALRTCKLPLFHYFEVFSVQVWVRGRFLDKLGEKISFLVNFGVLSGFSNKNSCGKRSHCLIAIYVVKILCLRLVLIDAAAVTIVTAFFLFSVHSRVPTDLDKFFSLTFP